MYSFPSMNVHEQYQQAGAASQAISHHTQNTWRNQQAGSESNSWRYNTVRSGFQQPQGSNVSLHNGGYSHSQMSGWHGHVVSHQAVSPQQLTEGTHYSRQALMSNGQKELPNSQKENTGFPTSHGVLAHRHYGNINQDFTDSAPAQTRKTTSVSFNKTSRGSSLMPELVDLRSLNVVCSDRQNDARHASNPNVYVSNSATSQCSIYNGNAMYLLNGQNLSESNAHQKAQQYPAELRSAYNYSGAGSNATNSVQYVLHKLNDFNDSSSYCATKGLHMLSRRVANGSGTNGPPPPYSASGHSVQQSVRNSQSDSKKEPAPNVRLSQDNSRQYLHGQFKSNISKGALSSAPKDGSSTLRYWLTTSSHNATGAPKVKARNASPSDNRISKENPAVSLSDSSRVTTPHFSPPKNGNQSPRCLSDTFIQTGTPSPVQPSDCSAHATPPGTKVIAVVQPLPCENVQVCSERMSPDKDKECIPTVEKIVAWLRKEVAGFSGETCGMKTSEGGSKDDSDLVDVRSSPQSSVKESQLDNEKEDAQKSVPSPTLESTESPKDQEEGEEKETSRPESTNVFLLKEDDVYTEQPYKSSWLNVNEQLDDIDKEFGFPWSLKCQYYKHESDDESDGESDDESDDKSDDKTNGVMTAGASSPLGSEMSNQVFSQTQLSPAQTAEDAEAWSPKSINDGDIESCYSFKLHVLSPDVAKHVYEQAASFVTLNMEEDTDTGSSESKLIDEAPDPKMMEKPSGSLLCKPMHKTVHAAREGDGSSDEKNTHHITLIDLTNDQSTAIIISDEDEDFIIVEKEIPAKIPDPDVNTPAAEEMCAASVQMTTLESPDSPTSRESDDQADCEQSRVKSAEVNEPNLDFQAPLSDLSDLSSNESFEIRKPKKCKVSDVDSQHALERFSKRDETFVDAAAARPTCPVQETVQLALYGSAQIKGPGVEPPTFLSVFLNPLKRKGQEDVCRAEKPVKQRILEKWMQSLQPVKIRKKKTSPANSLKTGMDQRDRQLKRRKVVKKNPKKYAVTVKESNDRGKSEPKNENQDPLAIQENIVLKFTVLPNTFAFKDRSETMEETPAANSAGCELSVKKPEPVEGKRQSHKAKVTWNMNPSKLVLPTPFPKKSDVFHEFQKKHTKKTSAVYRR